MLTPKERELMSAIQMHCDIYGIAPSYLEMLNSIGSQSRSTVYRSVCRLEELGHIRREGGRGRGIEVIKPIQLSIIEQAKLEAVKAAALTKANERLKALGLA